MLIKVTKPIQCPFYRDEDSIHWCYHPMYPADSPQDCGEKVPKGCPLRDAMVMVWTPENLSPEEIERLLNEEDS